MMKARNVCIGFAASLLLCTAVSAQTIYKSEKNGVTSYSTKPSPDSNAVKLPELSVIPGSGNAQQHQHNPMAAMPALPVPDSMIPGNGTLLPPPPPSLGVKPPAASLPVGPSRDELQAQLTKARAELAAQDEIRLGDERNYQKKLDRIKPYQTRVEELSRQLGVSP